METKTDLLKRLRSADFIHDRFVNPDGPEAADEIERLREEHHDVRILNEQYFNENEILLDEIERLREALRNIAMRGPDGELWNTKAEIWMIAEAALQQKESE